jgi:hypothetical protein
MKNPQRLNIPFTLRFLMDKKRKQIIAVVIVICIVIVAILAFVLLQGEEETMLNEEFPGDNGSNATVVAQGNFQDGAHPTEGKALLIAMDNELIVRLENFKTDPGPGLYVYLSEDTGANDYISLGKLKATEGNMNYDVPPNTNTAKYNKVLIWCEPFSVLFGHAELS